MTAILDLFKLNFNSIPQSIIFLDQNFNIIFINEVAGVVFEDLLPENEVVNLGDIMTSKRDISEVKKEILDKKKMIILKDCQIKTIETIYIFYFLPIYNSNGDFCFYFCVFRPRHKNKDIHTADNPYYEIFDKLNTGIVHGENLSIIDINQSFTELTGLTKAQVVGKNALKLAAKVRKRTDLSQASSLIKDYLLNRKIDKKLLKYDDKILEISSSNSNNTVMLRDVTEEQRTLSRLEDLHNVAGELAQDHSIEDYIRITLQSSHKILDFSISSIILFKGDYLHIYQQEDNDIVVKLKESRRVHRNPSPKKIYFNNDLTDYKGKMNFDQHIKSVICVPIDDFGVFQTHALTVNAFRDNDKKMAELLILHLKQALHRAETKNKMMQQEKKYKALFNNSAVSTVMTDAKGEILLANDRFQSVFKFDQTFSLNNVFTLFNDQDTAELKNQIKFCQQTDQHETYILETNIKYLDYPIISIICYLKMLPGNQNFLISFANVTKMKVYEKNLNKSLKEKDVLLKEIHHRVKNNLQIVASFIRMYLTDLTDFNKQQIIKDINAKIHTIGIVHERLYKSDSYKDISISNYIRKLIPELLSSYKQRKILVSYNLEDVVIDLNKSIPLALILSEVVANCIKHAFPKDFKGQSEISIELSSDDKFCTFKIADNGIGMVKAKKSFGHELISILTKQLGAESQFESAGGVTFTLKMPCK